jgi:hypothetical protein
VYIWRRSSRGRDENDLGGSFEFGDKAVEFEGRFMIDILIVCELYRGLRIIQFINVMKLKVHMKVEDKYVCSYFVHESRLALLEEPLPHLPAVVLTFLTQTA